MSDPPRVSRGIVLQLSDWLLLLEMIRIERQRLARYDPMDFGQRERMEELGSFLHEAGVRVSNELRRNRPINTRLAMTLPDDFPLTIVAVGDGGWVREGHGYRDLPPEVR